MQVTQNVQHGTLLVSGDDYDFPSYTYEPLPEFSGEDSFTVALKDSYGNGTSETVYIDVLPIHLLDVNNEYPTQNGYPSYYPYGYGVSGPYAPTGPYGPPSWPYNWSGTAIPLNANDPSLQRRSGLRRWFRLGPIRR